MSRNGLFTVRLVQVLDPESGKRVGVLEGDFVYDLTAVDPVRAASTLTLIRASRSGSLPELTEELLARSTGPRWTMHDLDVPPGPRPHLIWPLDSPEIWGAGVTYEVSRTARISESREYGFVYAAVYESDRPELFLKTANMLRVVGPNAPVIIRTDSRSTVPEPELAVAIDENGSILGCTIANDLTARDIEAQNPLYLPQAKIFRGCCALGPALYITRDFSHLRDWVIEMRVLRGDGRVVFRSEVGFRLMRRRLHELVTYLLRDNVVVTGTVLMTGTGIVPPDGFSLQAGDLVEISVEPIGLLRNPVRSAADPEAGPTLWNVERSN